MKMRILFFCISFNYEKINYLIKIKRLDDPKVGCIMFLRQQITSEDIFFDQPVGLLKIPKLLRFEILAEHKADRRDIPQCEIPIFYIKKKLAC